MSQSGIPFAKLEALGNSYIVVEPKHKAYWAENEVKTWCSPDWGLGSDGILWGPFYDSEIDPPRLIIFNSDGSQAEKSGNGLRIFSRYLWDKELVKENPFTIYSPAGPVESKVFKDMSIEIQMGEAKLLGPVEEEMSVAVLTPEGEKEISFDMTRVSVGNPHCCVFGGFDYVDHIKQWGEAIESHYLFPRKTNVQFVKVEARDTIFFEVWERGSGYTQASGSSACAVAFSAFKRGLVDRQLKMKMPGGTLFISIEENDSVIMRGDTAWICEGVWKKPEFPKDPQSSVDGGDDDSGETSKRTVVNADQGADQEDER
ncbi:diaminopimelate epimerase [bacterium]|nr:diaminopimelate epimerase [bacterium]